jgi:type I restriction enzyme S subunit
MPGRGESINPANHPDEMFDLYSIPAFDGGEPELLRGSEIGSTKQAVEPGDVMISKIVPHIRRAWAVGLARGRRMIASSEWIVFRDERIDPGYMKHQLVENRFHARFMQTVSGVGGSLLRARPAHVAKIEILLLPIAEQRRIAAVLDKADELRAKRRAALAELDTITQSIFLEMFGDPAADANRFPVHPLESLLRQPLQNGAYYPKDAYTEDAGVEMVHMSDAFYKVVPRGNLKRVNCAKTDVQKYALTELDILVARRSLTLEGAAKPCLIPKSDEPLIFESSFIRVAPHHDKITALYLYHYLANERIKRKRVQPYITQSTISGINQSNLARVLVTCPPVTLQQDFACRAAAIESLKVKHRTALAELDSLFASLQHRAFRGEL